jgi:hypothetical protein
MEITMQDVGASARLTQQGNGLSPRSNTLATDLVIRVQNTVGEITNLVGKIHMFANEMGAGDNAPPPSIPPSGKDEPSPQNLASWLTILENATQNLRRAFGRLDPSV